MRHLSAALLCLTLLLSALPARAAQADESWQTDTPRSHAESVMAALLGGDAKKGFAILFSKGRYPQNTLEKIQFDYFQQVNQQGPPIAYELILNRKAGESLVRLKYILLFKTMPYLFDLYYYHTTNGWTLKTFTMSRDIKQMFGD